MTAIRILVTGANGQLGKSIASLAPLYPQFVFTFANREQLSITDADAVNGLVADVKPGFIINAAAYTAVDKAETDIGGANAVNGIAPGILAAASRAAGAGFVHVSTDYVFDGTSETPYTEDHPTDPVNEYGRSKLAGEKLVMKEDPRAIIIRTAWVYSEFGNNFVKTMMRLMKDRPEIGVVYDQVGAPTYAVDLAASILDIIAKSVEAGEVWVPGIYHYSNRGKISWYDFACAIKSRIGANSNVKAITTPEFPTPAKRPAFSLLDTQKIRDTFQLTIPQWEHSLDICLKRLVAQP
jgi:dTDP-4-dehydrorhamnose reductase